MQCLPKLDGLRMRGRPTVDENGSSEDSRLIRLACGVRVNNLAAGWARSIFAGDDQRAAARTFEKSVLTFSLAVIGCDWRQAGSKLLVRRSRNVREFRLKDFRLTKMVPLPG